MEKESDKKSLIERIPSFSLILIMIILIVVGIGLIPMLSLSYMPSVRESNTLSIYARWPGASAKVMEAEVTSKLEGVVSMASGIEKITSTSSNGDASINIKLKKGANLNSVRFEISSLLKQVADKLPDGVGYPYLSDRRSSMASEDTKLLLTYRIYADMQADQIENYAENNIKSYLDKIKGVEKVTIDGVMPNYLEIKYDPEVLINYGFNSSIILEGIQNFIGQKQIIGDIQHVDEDGNDSRISILLSSIGEKTDVSAIPLKKVNGKMIYLRDIAQLSYKTRLPNTYFRVNGKNTIYFNVYVNKDANLISLSEKVRTTVDDLSKTFVNGYEMELLTDSAKNIKEELHKLIRRTLLSLAILLVFVYLVSRSFRYLIIIAITLAANTFMSVIFYYLFDIELNLYSMAGIAVSFGIIIDTSIVMVDHYGYYHNRKVFVAILAALLTTICSLICIYFMPDQIKDMLIEFASIIIINLTVSMFIALLFVPAIIDRYSLKRKDIRKSLKWRRFVLKNNRVYTKFINFGQRYKWMFIVVLILSFGIPIHLLPATIGKDEWGRRNPKMEEPKWYHKVYNETIGSNFYQSTLKKPLELTLGGTFRLFTSVLKGGSFSSSGRTSENRVTLRIGASMPEGSTVQQLNDVVLNMDRFLASFNEIEKFETSVSQKQAGIYVNFKPEFERGSFPPYLESLVISNALIFGGADWSTSGVSERGFSNSLNLDSKSNRISLRGYNYEMLYGFAQDLADEIVLENKRVTGPEVQGEGGYGYYYGGRGDRLTELYIKYDMEKVALYNVNLSSIYSSISEKLNRQNTNDFVDTKGNRTSFLVLSSKYEDFDNWTLSNSYFNVNNQNIRYSLIGNINKRKVDQSISKENQMYSLNVAFNFMGSWESADKFIKGKTEEYNNKMPIGFTAGNDSFGWYSNQGTQYWIILIIVVLIFFICAILFESLLQPFVIIMLIPVSFIGLFLTFYLSELSFGQGGFAAMILLCGIVVNAGIYIMNEYNNTKNYGSDAVRRYVRAYNHKIIPIMLTITSTVLGLIPFMIDGPKETFWFPFAVGTCGGLLFSIIALIMFIPVFLRLKNAKVIKVKKERKRWRFFKWRKRSQTVVVSEDL